MQKAKQTKEGSTKCDLCHELFCWCYGVKESRKITEQLSVKSYGCFSVIFYAYTDCTTSSVVSVAVVICENGPWKDGSGSCHFDIGSLLRKFTGMFDSASSDVCLCGLGSL